MSKSEIKINKQSELKIFKKIHQIINTTHELNKMGKSFLNCVKDKLKFSFACILLIDKSAPLKTIAFSTTNLSIDKKKAISNNIKNIIVSDIEKNTLIDKEFNQIKVENISELIPAYYFIDTLYKDKDIITSYYAYPIKVANHEKRGLFIFSVNEKQEKFVKNNKDFIYSLKELLEIGINKAITQNILNNTNKKILKMDKIKDDLIVITSHELKTPLAIAKNALWMLQQTENKSQQLKYLNLIDNSLKNMTMLISTNLTTSKIDRCELKLDKSNTNLTKLIRKAIKTLEPQLTQRQLQYELLNPSKNDIYTKLDKHYILEVLINLIDNAIKYSYKSSVIRMEIGKLGNEIYFKINNKGPTIKKNDQKKMFNKFTRLHPNFGKSDGSGFGLYITKRFIELHGGKISVSSNKLKGTTFKFSIPILQ